LDFYLEVALEKTTQDCGPDKKIAQKMWTLDPKIKLGLRSKIQFQGLNLTDLVIRN